MTIQPHAPNWYDRLSSLQQGYFYPWKSRIAPGNGEEAYLYLVHQYLTTEKDVLDVGCGHGDVALELAPHCRSILAYDRVERYIQIAQEVAREKNVKNVTYVCFDSSDEFNNGAARIPAETQSFDLMISRRGPLHWLEDARRVARPGAILIQLNPLETPLPPWANRLPEPLRSAAGIESQTGMLNSVKYRLELGGLALHSAWTYDVPEFLDDPHELYTRLSWGYIPGEVPAWDDVRSIIEQIFSDYSTEPDGLVMRHTRLLWTAFVKTKS
jgi:ubiquinone/menaquinone biosynthesis C-methylase UbiE